jgi:hypothetical protein
MRPTPPTAAARSTRANARSDAERLATAFAKLRKHRKNSRLLEDSATTLHVLLKRKRVTYRGQLQDHAAKSFSRSDLTPAENFPHFDDYTERARVQTIVPIRSSHATTM